MEVSTIKNYHDLEVWQLGRQLVKAIYVLTESFPVRESYGLAQQLRRAAVSVPSNIAEGHSRTSTRDFIQFISMSIGSLAEVDTQLILAVDLEYIQQQDADVIFRDITLLQKKLHSLRVALRARIDSANPKSQIPNPELVDG